MENACTSGQAQLVEEIFARVAGDLSMMIDRPMEILSTEAKQSDRTVTGRSAVHISFKLSLDSDGQTMHGCLLVPLPDAISMACYLQMVPDEGVAERRRDTNLDRTTKDAMLEIGNFIGGSLDAVLRERFGPGVVSARSEGCQGVRPNVAPAFGHVKSCELIVGFAEAKVGHFPTFGMALMMPMLDAVFAQD